MKWFDNILKKDNSANTAFGLALSDLNAWLDQKSQNPELEGEIKEIYSKIGSVAEDLAADIKVLRFATADKSAPPRLLNAGLAARDALLTQMKGLSEKLVPPSVTSVNSAAEYYSRLVKGLGNTVLKFGRAQKYVAALFPGQANKLNSDLNKISHLLVDLNEVVNKSQSELLEINALKELGAEVQDKLHQIRVLKVNLEDAKQKLADLQALELRTKTELDELKSTEKGKKTKAINELLDLKHLERTRIEIEMAELVSPLSKALARLVKQDSSDRLELQHRRVLELLSSSPHEALNGDISEPLLELKSKVHLLGLKDRKREKILMHVGLLIKDKPLETLKAKHSKISGNIKALEQELSETSHEMTKLEDLLKQTSQQIEKLKADVDESEGALSTINDLVSKEETELKAKVEKMVGGPVTWIEG